MTSGTHESATKALIFWSGDHEDVQSHQIEGETHLDTSYNRDPIHPVHEGPENHKRISAYVELFETMIRIVIEHERHLLSEFELGALQKLLRASYNARYLLVRLSLRKPDKWHRLRSLNYQSEMGDKDHIISAIHELTGKPDPTAETSTGPVVIDLTLDDDEDSFSVSQNAQVASKIKSQQSEFIPSNEMCDNSSLAEGTNPEVEADVEITGLADDESHMSLYELLDCLSVEELKGIARQMKIKTTQKRHSLINAVLAFSSTQSMIEFPAANSSRASNYGSQAPVSLSVGANKIRSSRQQGERLREMILKAVVKCVRINKILYKLFKRVDLVYFRGTEYSQTLLTPALLTRFHKRRYPFYTCTRTPNIWCTRKELLAYESALQLEASIVGMVDETNYATRPSDLANGIPGPSMRNTTEVDPGNTAKNAKRSEQEKENLESEENAGKDGEQGSKPQNDKLLHAQIVKEIFLARVYPKWKDLVGEQRLIEESRVPGLERFECGHIYTRMVHKCTRVLGLLKDHPLELEVLENLLAQRLWLRGKRGKWHNRRVLILMTYCGKGGHVMRKALDAVVEGLEDDDTHLFHRPILVRRLIRLEERLQIPLEERHCCNGEMRKPAEVCIKGIRIRKTMGTPTPDFRSFKTSSSVPTTPVSLSKAWGPLSPMSTKSEKVELVRSTSKYSQAQNYMDQRPQNSGKSIWRGQDGEEVNVEILALQHYQRLGYKGYHSEGSIVRTIFGLLFFDILFASIPGAFETPYQSAPLDIAEDSFYFARRDLIEARLSDIESGAAAEIATRVDEEHREKNTWCVGVHWDLFKRQDLAEIVHCIEGKFLSAICRLLCEDYAARGAGLPDLFLWNAKDACCKFVEVKGPGDSLQENQKVWIDFLLRVGMSVEVCHVNETGKPEKNRKPKQVVGSNVKKRRGETKSTSDVGVALESKLSADNRKSTFLRQDHIEHQHKKRFAEQREQHLLPSISASRSSISNINRAEVVIVTPPKRRRLEVSELV